MKSLKDMTCEELWAEINRIVALDPYRKDLDLYIRKLDCYDILESKDLGQTYDLRGSSTEEVIRPDYSGPRYARNSWTGR